MNQNNTNSIRNAPIDIASTRILHYLRTHNYDDCAIYINRLSSNTFRKILVNDLSIDILLAQLPFSIEVFEVIYSKIFIHDPDYFPTRILKPEQIISKMISIFASAIETTVTTDKQHSASSTSLVSKSKEMGIDDERLLSNLSSILRIISYVQPILFKRLIRQKETIDECIYYFEQRSLATVNLLQDTLRHELESTIVCCQQAIHKLESKPSTSLSSSAHTTPVTARKRASTPAIPTPSSFDEVQNRLFQHKSILNLVEPFLSRTKLYSVMENLTNKVSMDKQILLAFSHIKSHEKQIPFGEPLLPLFKRFAFAYERIIQIWRRVTDSTLIDECTDDVLIDQTNTTITGFPSGICFERARSQEPRPYGNRYESDAFLYKDDMGVKTGRSTPLQPLAINGREQRNRILSNGPLQQQQITSNLPPAASLQSLSPVADHDEKEKLKNDILQLKTELQKSKETISRLQKSEDQMRERLAEQAQRQLEKGGKFEDLNQISRPTELIRSFNTLYSQARIDALDALDNVREMLDAEDLKSKLLFSVVVLAFRHAQIHARDIRNKIKQILQLTNDKNSNVLEETIEKYLRSTILKYDIEKIAFEVENQLWATLYDYPSLKNCNELSKYVNSACRTAWGLVNQTPPYYIEFQTTKYDKQIHERFHTSDNESEVIIEYVWPCLFDGHDRTCVAKGVVITDENYLTRKMNT